MRKTIKLFKLIYSLFSDTRGEVSPHKYPTNNDTQNHIYINHSKNVERIMKKNESIKLINIIQTTDKSALQKRITEKISKIISSEYNNPWKTRKSMV